LGYKLNKRIEELIPYEPITGEYKIRLDANESYIPLNPIYLEKAFEKIRNYPLNRYPDPYAAELCEQAGKLYHISPSLITAGNGSDELIALIVSTLFEKEQEIVTFEQDFSMYRVYGDLYGVKQKVLPKNEDLTIDVEGTISYINKNKTSGLIFSNPCNPTSLCESKENVLKIVSSVDAIVILDEAYMDFADQSIIDKVWDYDNLIILKTCSKAVGMAGVRLGFALANKVLTKALRAVKAPYNVNSISQCIGAALLEDKEYLAECSKELTAANREFYHSIVALNNKYQLFEIVFDTRTNFLYAKSSKAKLIYDKLLNASIAIRHLNGYLRMTVGNASETKTLLHGLEEIGKEMGAVK